MNPRNLETKNVDKEDEQAAVAKDTSAVDDSDGHHDGKKEAKRDPQHGIKDGKSSNTDDSVDTPDKPKKKKKRVHKLSLKATEDFNAKLQKRGVLYLARIPPRMNPTKIKTLLSEFGVVTRVYLVEEDSAKRKRRKKHSGSGGGKRYVEGWVEFDDKRVAKHVATNLNNTPISLQKRNVHYGDLWNTKYLRKFKWSHLTEKVAYERRMREQKLRIEMMQARRENASYTQLVETGKKLDKIEERKRKRGEKSGEKESKDESSKKRRKLKQTKPLEEGADQAAKRALLSSLV